jgi:hypothetical protein
VNTMTEREAFDAYRKQHNPCITAWEAWQAATLAERERCISICDSHSRSGNWRPIIEGLAP